MVWSFATGEAEEGLRINHNRGFLGPVLVFNLVQKDIVMSSFTRSSISNDCKVNMSRETLRIEQAAAARMARLFSTSGGFHDVLRCDNI